MPDFTGKTVIVTGAGSGIGAATVRLFSAAGANVLAFGRGQEKMDASIRGLPADRTIAVAGDAAMAADVGAAVAKAVERFGGLDVLVNNAGVVVQGDVTASNTVFGPWAPTFAGEHPVIQQRTDIYDA